MSCSLRLRGFACEQQATVIIGGAGYCAAHAKLVLARRLRPSAPEAERDGASARNEDVETAR